MATLNMAKVVGSGKADVPHQSQVRPLFILVNLLCDIMLPSVFGLDQKVSGQLPVDAVWKRTGAFGRVPGLGFHQWV